MDTQPEVGPEAYDIGADILYGFFQKILRQYDPNELTDLGKRIIQCCLNRGSEEDYKALISFEEK